MSYWEEHYRKGGVSGEGSVGAYRDWKWGIIERLASPIDDVVDVGCGDLSFWEGRTCQSYWGLDISETIINQNRIKRPTWDFLTRPAEEYVPMVRGRIVLCLDVLFHVMDEDVYRKIIKNLGLYSTEWIFINTWRNSPFKDKNTDGKYQTYWEFIPAIEGFKRVDWVEHPDGFNVMVCIRKE